MYPTLKKMPDGSVIVDPVKRYVKNCLLVPDATNTPIVIAANGQSPPISLEAPQDSVCEGLYFQGFHGPAVAADVRNRMEVELFDQAWGRLCMNRPVLVDHVFGTQLNPFYLKESFLLQPQQVLRTQFFNRSAAGATNFQPALTGSKIQYSDLTTGYANKFVAENWTRKTFLQPFWITTDAAVTVPASGTVTAFMTNTRDKTLVLYYAMARAITTGVAGDVQEIFTTQVLDGKTQRPYQNNPVTLNTGWGTGTFPYVLPHPIILEQSTQLQITITNLITDQPTEVFLTFHGVGCFEGKSLNTYLPSGTPALDDFQGRGIRP